MSSRGGGGLNGWWTPYLDDIFQEKSSFRRQLWRCSSLYIYIPVSFRLSFGPADLSADNGVP